MGEMALLGSLHPVLVHFPIALVMAAVVIEWVAAIRADLRIRSAAVVNVKVGAAFAVMTSVAGWRLAIGSGIEGPLLEWHRWLGIAAAGVTLAAALAVPRADSRAPRGLWIYRIALVVAALLVAVAAHLGGVLVWGTDFLRL